MSLEKNIENVASFLPEKTKVVELVSGKMHEYNPRIGMGHSMNAYSKIVELLKICGISFEEIFASGTDEDGNEIPEKERKTKNFSELEQIFKSHLPLKEFAEKYIETVSILIKQDVAWVSENLEDHKGLGIIIPFFLKKVASWREAYLETLMEINKESKQIMNLDTEKLSSGALPEETNLSQELKNSSIESQPDKS